MNFIRHYLLAVQFFTRIPVTGALAGWVGYSPAMLRASAAHFPGVGWLVALAACATYAAVMAALPATPFTPLAAAVACTVVTVMLTGGFHEDGLADVADGLGGSADRERALQIMKDSRVGAFGAMAVSLALLFKVSLLAVLGSQHLGAAVSALAVAHVVSRLGPLLLIRVLPHVGDDAGSKSKPLADRISRGALAIAALWCLPVLWLGLQMQGAAFMACGLLGTAIAVTWMGRLFARRLQGFTGDCLGATQQVCEIAFYLGAATML